MILDWHNNIHAYAVLVNIFDPNNKVTVTKDGFIIIINDGLPLVYTPTEGGHEEL